MFKWGRRVILFLLLSVGLWQVGEGSYIYAKAQLAQELILDAWEEGIANRQPVKPWSWADTWPVARLVVPRLGIDQIVLAGDNGRALAFGPGHRFGTPLPGEVGNSLVAGHRDTHFGFLKNLRIDDTILVQDQAGAVHQYIINAYEVVDESMPVEEVSEQQLTLVTCYPFDAVVPGGPLRYVVTATVTTAKWKGKSDNLYRQQINQSEPRSEQF
ncbi:LPXTG-site transpeptidase family protein [hydrothermal vent metagenome]|uniref:LPXTG-site transpeptidase family protein n=1 Tax=hydrothermal vent metagenome TaxID=652676 RepID=A0A3B0YU43_9ZZZZ